MGTGLGMAEKGADLVGSFGRENVLELASLLLDFVFVLYFQGLREQSFCKPMTSYDIGSTLLTCLGEIDDELAMLL